MPGEFQGFKAVLEQMWRKLYQDRKERMAGIKQPVYREIKKYKYQLVEPYTHQLPEVFEGYTAGTEWINLLNTYLTAWKGYSWDGATGAFDTKTIFRGALIHDILYQLIRIGCLPKEFRIEADRELRRICIEDGMGRFRAWYVYFAVRKFGGLNI